MPTVRLTSTIPVAADFARRMDGEVLICIDYSTGLAYTYANGAVVSLVAAGGVSSVTLAMMANLAVDTLIGRATAGAGIPEAISLTAAGRALLDDASVSAQRTTLGLGTIAVAAAADYLAVADAAWSSWTPTRTGWTDAGAPTVTGRKCKVGKVAYFQMQVVPGITVATVAGTSYVTLPYTAAGITGGGSMMNSTTLIGVGNCVIDVANSRVHVPTQGATANTLTVGGWFETS